jgi:hypothetical protein
LPHPVGCGGSHHCCKQGAGRPRERAGARSTKETGGHGRERCSSAAVAGCAHSTSCTATGGQAHSTCTATWASWTRRAHARSPQHAALKPGTNRPANSTTTRGSCAVALDSRETAAHAPGAPRRHGWLHTQSCAGVAFSFNRGQHQIMRQRVRTTLACATHTHTHTHSVNNHGWGVGPAQQSGHHTHSSSSAATHARRAMAGRHAVYTRWAITNTRYWGTKQVHVYTHIHTLLRRTRNTTRVHSQTKPEHECTGAPSFRMAIVLHTIVEGDDRAAPRHW